MTPTLTLRSGRRIGTAPSADRIITCMSGCSTIHGKVIAASIVAGPGTKKYTELGRRVMCLPFAGNYSSLNAKHWTSLGLSRFQTFSSRSPGISSKVPRNVSSPSAIPSISRNAAPESVKG